MSKGGFTYIITNKTNTVLYIGVTSELRNRIYQHREKLYSNSFTAKYNLNKLVYFEFFEAIEEAIDREKQLKNYSRAKKDTLVNTMNLRLVGFVGQHTRLLIVCSVYSPQGIATPSARNDGTDIF